MSDLDHSDVLVIGAGIHGTGVAQALAAAGHSVHILEARGAASGTSSRSSKLIHGGLRYLETFQLKLVRESLKERAVLLRVAPHLVRLVPFHIPVYRSTSRGPWTLRAGLSLYAMLGGLGRDARFRKVTRGEWEHLDGLSTDGLRAVYRYQDGQTDDAALTRAVHASAEELGAGCTLGAEVLSAQRTGDHWRVRYSANGVVEERTARVVVNAAGPWANRVLDRFQPRPPGREVDLVGGTHIELAGTLENGCYYCEAPQDKRAVFCLPWRDRVLVGTTEQAYDGDPRQIAPTPQEVAYLLEIRAHYFPDAPTELLDSWAGLRVLPKGDGKAFWRTREVILVADDGANPSVVTIYGGKLTGYRLTALKIEKLLRRSLERRQQQADTATLGLPDLENA